MVFPLDPFCEQTIEGHFRKKRNGFCWTEEYLLAAVEKATSKYDVYWAAIGLRKVGTQKAIPVLCTLLSYPMQDVKCVSILTIGHIGRADSTPILAEALLSPAYREKGYALWAIEDAADERAVPAVLAHLKKNLSKIRRGLDASGALTHAVPYLAKYCHLSRDAQQFLDEMPSYWQRLGEGERKELTKRVPEIVQQIDSVLRGSSQSSY